MENDERFVLSQESASGRSRWTKIDVQAAAAAANASQLAITVMLPFTSDRANSSRDVQARFQGLTDQAASLPFKVHRLNN